MLDPLARVMHTGSLWQERACTQKIWEWIFTTEICEFHSYGFIRKSVFFSVYYYMHCFSPCSTYYMLLPWYLLMDSLSDIFLESAVTVVLKCSLNVDLHQGEAVFCLDKMIISVCFRDCNILCISLPEST